MRQHFDLGERVIVRLNKERVIATVISIYPYDPNYVLVKFDSGKEQDVRSSQLVRMI